MSDKEILELAAKAAEIEIEKCGCKNEKFPFKHKEIGLGHWNPLEDDGDALRLAIKLEMEINCMELSQFQVTTYDDKGNATYTDDSCVRRAITRAAAEIGKGM